MAVARFFVAVAVALAALGIVSAGPAHACSCDSVGLAEYIDEATVAFTGRQVDRVVLNEFDDNGAVLMFEVDEIYKGELGPLVELRTHAQGSACGIDAADRGVTGVVAWKWKGHLNAGLCGSLVSGDELEAVLGAGSPPDERLDARPLEVDVAAPVPSEDSDDRIGLWVAGGTLLAVALAGGAVILALVLNKRRSFP